MSAEVNIENEQYEVISNEWRAQFKLFINELNESLALEDKVIYIEKNN